MEIRDQVENIHEMVQKRDLEDISVKKKYFVTRYLSRIASRIANEITAFGKVY